MAERNMLQELSGAIADLVERASRCVVRIDGELPVSRSGTIVDATHVLTVAQQAEEGERVGIVLIDGSTTNATVVGYDAESELVLLRADRELPGGPLPAREGEVRVGELAFTVALPSSEGVEARHGIVRCVAKAAGDEGKEGTRYLQTDSLAFPGFAGSPVVDAEGRLLGISALGSRPESAYIVPAADALAAVKTMTEKGSPKTGYLGVRTIPAEIPASAGSGGAAGETGLLVAGVEEGSPAAKAGILTGDIIVSLNGRRTSSHEELFAALASLPGDGTVTVDVIRAGKKETLSVTPGTRRESITRRWHQGRRGGQGWCR